MMLWLESQRCFYQCEIVYKNPRNEVNLNLSAFELLKSLRTCCIWNRREPSYRTAHHKNDKRTSCCSKLRKAHTLKTERPCSFDRIVQQIMPHCPKFCRIKKTVIEWLSSHTLQVAKPLWGVPLSEEEPVQSNLKATLAIRFLTYHL